MNRSQALNVLKPAGNTLADLKTAYRTAVKKYHPDINPNGLELMKIINSAFAFLKEHINTWSFKETTEGPAIDKTIQDLFNKIQGFDGVTAEVCGSWLWLSGNTFEYKKALKGYGFRFAGKKRQWYWRPADYKKKSRRVFSMEEIRLTFGSIDLEGRTQAIAA